MRPISELSLMLYTNVPLSRYSFGGLSFPFLFCSGKMASNTPTPWTLIKLVKSNTSILLDLRCRRLFHLEDDVALIADMIGFWQTIKEALSLYQARPLVKKIDLGSGQED